MIKYFLFLITGLLTCYITTAGNEPGTGGGRAAAMANAAVCHADGWAAFHNPAGLAYLQKLSAGVFQENPFLLNELSTRGIFIAVPFKNLGVFSLNGNYFGYRLYNEKKIGLAYSKSFGEKISAGLQLDYLNTSIAEGYGSRSAFTIEAGMRAQIFPGLLLGAHVFNPSRAKLANYADEKFPTIMKLGLEYIFTDNLNVSIEAEKNISSKNIFKAGLEYHVVEILYLRAGIAANPAKTSFGFGLKFSSFTFDFASSYHQYTGYSPHVSITYSAK